MINRPIDSSLIDLNIRSYKDADFFKLEKLLKETGLFYEPLDKRDILKRKIF